METTSVLASLPITNGTFTSNVTGWSGWPSQAILAHNTTKLDNGCLKVTFNNNASSNTFTMNPTATVPVQQGSWYRVRFSIVGDGLGELRFAYQGNSQMNTSFSEGARVFPYDTQRRDVEHYFQSSITEQGLPRFATYYTDGVYYLDNVSMDRVNAVPVDPSQRNRILVNETASAQTVAIPAGCWKDTDGNVMGATLTLPPCQSRVIYRYSTDGNCAGQVDCAGVSGGGALPGTPCNDNNPCTINDTWSAGCQCAGTASGLQATVTANGPTSFCTGGSVVLSANAGTGYTYQWRNNGVNISGAVSSTYTATASGSYTVVVTSNGCSATSAAVAVSASSPSATITAGGPTAFCSGGSVVLSANTGTGLTYQWRRNGTAINGATAASYTATLAGTYTVVVTANGCSTTSAGTTVTVSAAPTATIAAGGPTTFCAGGSVVLSA
ncbi:MAG: hypothetical protein ACK4L7_11125, partial [Flavobacteriales bacterium]